MVSKHEVGYKPFRLAASGLVKTGGGFLNKIVVSSVEANTCQVEIYDNTSATGDVVWECETQCVVAAHQVAEPFSCEFTFHTGCYIKITGLNSIVSGSYV
jgi:hypothetical protein